MAKYLIIVHDGKDYISSKKNVRSLAKENENKDFEVFNSLGLLEYFYDSSMKKALHICDGMRRKYAYDTIKENKINTIIGDSAEIWLQNDRKKPATLKWKAETISKTRGELLDFLYDIVYHNDNVTENEKGNARKCLYALQDLYMDNASDEWEWYKDTKGQFYTEGEYTYTTEKHYIKDEDDWTACYGW